MKIFFNRFRLGDCLWACHWLRKVALANPTQPIAFFCDKAHHWQLAPLLTGTQVYLFALEAYHGGGIDTWINARGEYPPKDKDQVKFFTQVFDRVAAEAGLQNPLQKREDWLFDYPGLGLDDAAKIRGRSFFAPDWLIVDSTPQSGQFRFVRQEMDDLLFRISKNSKIIYRTGLNTENYSVTEWGYISASAQNILMIATGPCWTTFNAVTESRIKNRIILQGEGMILNYGREWPHFTNLPDAVKYMEKEGLV